MIKLIKKIFGIKESVKQSTAAPSGEESLAQKKYSGFDIEYLPHAERYFPRYKGKYFYWWITRQNFTLEDRISGCEYSKSEAGAKAIIDKYLELRGVGSRIITLD